MRIRYGDDRDTVDARFERLYADDPAELARYWRRVRGEEPVRPRHNPDKEIPSMNKTKSSAMKIATKAMKAGGPQAVGGSAFQAYREQAAQERRRMLKSLGVGAAEGDRARALDGASRPAIRNATRPWQAAPNPAAVLQDVLDGRAKSVPVPQSIRRATVAQIDAHTTDSRPELGEIETEIEALKAALAKSTDVFERERLSWRLTRQQLVLGHRLGEC